MPKFRALRNSFHDEVYYKSGEVYVFGSKKPPTRHFAPLGGESPHPRYTEDTLMGMSKQTLVALAKKERVPVTYRTDKKLIVDMILTGDVVEDEGRTLQEVADAETPAAKILENAATGKGNK